jgi:hypothetical protein
MSLARIFLINIKNKIKSMANELDTVASCHAGVIVPFAYVTADEIGSLGLSLVEYNRIGSLSDTERLNELKERCAQAMDSEHALITVENALKTARQNAAKAWSPVYQHIVSTRLAHPLRWRANLNIVESVVREIIVKYLTKEHDKGAEAFNSQYVPPDADIEAMFRERWNAHADYMTSECVDRRFSSILHVPSSNKHVILSYRSSTENQRRVECVEQIVGEARVGCRQGSTCAEVAGCYALAPLGGFSQRWRCF